MWCPYAHLLKTATECITSKRLQDGAPGLTKVTAKPCASLTTPHYRGAAKGYEPSGVARPLTGQFPAHPRGLQLEPQTGL
jgi:hypothetical protein